MERDRLADVFLDACGKVCGNAGHGGTCRQAGFAAGHVHGEVPGEHRCHRQAHPARDTG
jgi:hypothetical protein